MKYFEIEDPYYALLKAENTQDAVTKYNETVGDLEEASLMKEVPREYTLEKFILFEGKETSINKIIQEFYDEEITFLLVDSALN